MPILMLLSNSGKVYNISAIAFFRYTVNAIIIHVYLKKLLYSKQKYWWGIKFGDLAVW